MRGIFLRYSMLVALIFESVDEISMNGIQIKDTKRYTPVVLCLVVRKPISPNPGQKYYARFLFLPFKSVTAAKFT